ncbi:hypothetical protein FOA43_002320 [Brettanomyces nanus]|uniref:U6 small nuclear RNA (adenine-(43)-N(6))-methyltransferase n=1 Tax=Eeniella nana TaxID=13502 RepID=A0A875RPF7_EENNA|nr:uncharacterized protein FOA43_002320 [Brettanomyces nanus]QPG74980.1 hypothetical protein FOA43_002320 [Brettanomyces nanus]
MEQLDFQYLVSLNPKLSKYYDEKLNKYDFQSNDAVILLTETLFITNLNLDVHISNDRLCPRYFNRLDYIYFIQELMEGSSLSPESKYFGLDIGTGQMAVYPLMAVKIISELTWILATDIDQISVNMALKNVQNNHLSEKILIELVDKDDNCFRAVNQKDTDDAVGFTMCNPPFYSSIWEMQSKRALKQANEDRETVVGTNQELIYSDGGELGFIQKLLKDSRTASKKILWFSSLAGNYHTVKTLVKEFDSDFNYGIYEFQSGLTKKATKRWIVYWSFQFLRPSISLFNSKVCAPPFRFIMNRKIDFAAAYTRIRDLPYLEISTDEDLSVFVKLPGNCWSRSYRRKRQQNSQKRTKLDGSCWFEVVFYQDQTLIYWKYGQKYQTFESFCGWLNNT